MVHHPRGAVSDDVFPVIFKVVRIAGHGDLDVVGRQEPIECSEFFRRFGDILAFGNRRNVVAACETWMADDGHGESTATSIEGSFDLRQLSFVHGTQDTGVNRKQGKIIGLQFEKGSALDPDIV